MKRVLIAAAIVLMSVPAQSQRMGGGKRNHSAEQKSGPQAPKPNEKAYRAAIDTLPDKPFDPWNKMRPTPGTPPTGH